MHDPMVVAFEIRSPWPRRSTFRDAIVLGVAGFAATLLASALRAVA